MEVLEKVYYGNTIRSYLVAAGIAISIPLLVWVLERALVSQLRRIAQRTALQINDLLIAAVSSTKLLLVAVLGVYGASLSLERSAGVMTATRTAAVIAFLVQLGIWINAGVSTTLIHYQEQKRESGDLSAVGSIAMLGLFGRILLWVFITMLLLNNVGVDITALVTGLGIGGIAVALAAQNILGDLFASISIMLDKPFEVGDSLTIGEFQGTVEQIGIKTTRLRSLSGEQLIFSNSDLLKSRIRNNKRMNERRVVFEIGVAYETPVERLEMLPKILRESVEALPQARFDRAHFKRFGDSSLIYETVYFVKNPNYNEYMDMQQAINLALFRRLRDAAIEISYPTRSIYLRRTEGEPWGQKP
jgi:small-conductance mechanosensitive channel